MNYKVEAEQIDWSTAEHQSFRHTEVSRTIPSPARNRAAVLVAYSSLFVLPLAFAGVHPKANLAFSFFLLAVTAFVMISPKIRAEFQPVLNSKPVGLFLTASFCFLLYTVAQNFLLGLGAAAHPVLGQVSGAKAWLQLSANIQPFVAFTAAALLWLSLLASGKPAEKMWRLLLNCGIFISVIALSHWYYDNGRLFWIFEPQNVFISERARWPFVNPNHLAAFLLPLVFLAWTQISIRVRELKEKIAAIHGQGLGLLFLSSRVQRSLLRLSFDLAVFMGVVLGLIGALSRSSWVGIGAGLAFFLSARTLFGGARSEADLKSGERNRDSTKIHWLNKFKTRRSKRRSRHKSILSHFVDFMILHFEKLYKGAVFLALVGALLFFLNQQGQELLAGRVEYALASSLDDARWAIFSDSWKIAKEHGLLGIGIGAWADYYPSYASPALAGLDPVYLHSDPYQLLIESGVIGFALVGAFAVLLLRASIRNIGSERLSKENRLRLLGVSSGMVALIVTSCFDFPLRIPAIFLLLSALLALNLYLLYAAEQP